MSKVRRMERGRYAVDVCGGDAVVEVWIHREHPPVLACRSAAEGGYHVELGAREALVVAALLIGSSTFDVWAGAGRCLGRLRRLGARLRG